MPRPDDWADLVNTYLTAKQQERIKQCIARGQPFGSPGWTERTAAEQGLNHTLRSAGRPRKGGNQ